MPKTCMFQLATLLQLFLKVIVIDIEAANRKVFCHFAMWCPGSGVVLACMGS